MDNDVRPAVCTYETAKELSRIAVAKNKTCKIHIKIDTGMCRIGFQVTEESADIIAQIAKLPNIMIEEYSLTLQGQMSCQRSLPLSSLIF